MIKILPLLLALAGLAAADLAVAQAVSRTPAQAEPLREVPVSVRTQPLSSAPVTHEAQVRTPPGEAAVTVRSLQPNSVVGTYRFRFSDLDVDGDGFISKEEAQANPSLADEFTSLDTARRGRLDRAQLAGWLIE